MTDLFYAIFTEYQGSTLASVLTGMHNTQAPETVVYPYSVFSLISDVPDWTFTENTEEILIQFNLFSKVTNAVQVCDLFEKLKDTYDFCDLAIANYETVSVVRENSILTREEKVWQYNVTYRVLLGKL